MLFFKEDKDVLSSLDEQIWTRTRIYMFTTAALVAVWGLFDFYMDYENLWIYLTLRAIYTPITLAIAYNFHRPFFRNNHKRWAMIHYILLIIDIGVMVLWTDNFVKYLIGFSTIFWGASVIMLWRFWNTVIPGIIVIIIAALRFYIFPHNVPTDEFITGLYYFTTCLVFTTVISSYGYWNAYILAQKNLELEKTHEKLIQVTRLSSMNRVVAGVAHEINTPVGTALTATTHAEEEIQKLHGVVKEGQVSIDQITTPAKNALESLEPAISELKRTLELITTFKKTAVDQSHYDKRQFDLVHYIDDNILRVTLKKHLKNVTVGVHGETELIIESYPGEYTQILINLVTNTLDHGYSGRDLSQQPGHIDIDLRLIDPDTLVMHYQDDGAGMNPETLSRVFEPFFTTAGQDADTPGRGHRGSGLGMSIVYNAVTHKLNGEIEAKSIPGGGAEFIIVLPVKVINKN